MSPTLALALGSTALSFMGSMSAAKAAKREAALQRRQLQAQMQGAELAALQEHNSRMKNLQVFLGTNRALAGVSGRDISTDRSFRAIQEKAKKEMSVETDRRYLEAVQQQAMLSLGKTIAAERGRNLARAYRYQAFGSLLSGAMKAQPLMAGTGTTSVLSPQFKAVGYGYTGGMST